jgi:hypothetical protein
MRSLLLGILAGFSLSVSFVVCAAGNKDDCVCERNYAGFSIVSVFDGVEFFYVASGDTMNEAGMRALRLISLDSDREFPEILLLPFSVSLIDRNYLLVKIDPKTGVPHSSVNTNKDGYSAWIERCICGKNKKTQRNKRQKKKKKLTTGVKFIEVK